jgi:hypothetical protein
MAVINEAFATHSIQFDLSGTQYIENQEWSSRKARNDMTSQLHSGSYSALNMYFLKSMGSGGVTGECSFPMDPNDFSNPELIVLNDGCILLSSTSPGGSYATYNLILNTVHEIGHWLGYVKYSDPS